MKVAATAPGKLALLGEYAVLHGAPALVIAVNHRCRAEVHLSADGMSRIETRFPAAHWHEAEPGTPIDVPLVDLVIGRWPGSGREPAWQALLDSTAFHAGDTKLGLGSSAAALCAFAGAWTAWAGCERPGLVELVALHRRFQSGAGSGLDVAASLTGGAIEFRLDPDQSPGVQAVSIPKSIGMACIFTGQSASTPDLLARYHAWRAARPAEAGQHQCALEDIAEAGCTAVRESDASGLLRAIDAYGEQMKQLGQMMGASVVTAAHERAARLARRFGLVYKVSGAGGGDLGVGMGADADALAAFSHAAVEEGLVVVDLAMASHGLLVEEQNG